MTRIKVKWRSMSYSARLLCAGVLLLVFAGVALAQITLFDGLSETIATLADGDRGGFNDADDSDQLKQVLASTIKTYTSSAPTFTGLTKFSVETGMSATNPGVQGDTPITTDIAQVSTVGTTSDAVTLPTAVAGQWVMIINDGANALEIWPASGDNLGAGVDTALGTDLAAGSNVTFRAYDATNWEEIAGGGGSGDVTKVGTPVDDQIGVWTGDGTIEGDSGLTWDGVHLQTGGGNGDNNDVAFGVNDNNTGFYMESTPTRLSAAVNGTKVWEYTNSYSTIDFPVTYREDTNTIATGAANADANIQLLAGEGAADDDLDTLNADATGQWVFLRASSDSVTITVKDGTGNIQCNGDFPLDNDQDVMLLIYDGTNWLEVSRSDNGM